MTDRTPRVEKGGSTQSSCCSKWSTWFIYRCCHGETPVGWSPRSGPIRSQSRSHDHTDRKCTGQRHQRQNHRAAKRDGKFTGETANTRARRRVQKTHVFYTEQNTCQRCCLAVNPITADLKWEFQLKFDGRQRNVFKTTKNNHHKIIINNQVMRRKWVRFREERYIFFSFFFMINMFSEMVQTILLCQGSTQWET